MADQAWNHVFFTDTGDVVWENTQHTVWNKEEIVTPELPPDRSGTVGGAKRADFSFYTPSPFPIDEFERKIVDDQEMIDILTIIASTNILS
jgi:hypothetical protein